MSEYAPNWNELEEKFKYVYELNGNEIATTTEFDSLLDMDYTKHIRPVILTDKAWYSLTTKHSRNKLVGLFIRNAHPGFHTIYGWYHVDQVDVHKKIPAEIWED